MEAGERGLVEELEEFAEAESVVAAMLTYCDPRDLRRGRRALSRPGSRISSPATEPTIPSGRRSGDRGTSSSTGRGRSSVRSDLDSVADLELGESAKIEQLRHVLL